MGLSEVFPEFGDLWKESFVIKYFSTAVTLESVARNYKFFGRVLPLVFSHFLYLYIDISFLFGWRCDV